MPLFGSKPSVPTIAQAAPETRPAHSELPDSSHPRGTCTRCGLRSSFDVVGSHSLTFNGLISYPTGADGARVAVERAATLQCRHCNQALVVVEEQWIGGKPWDKAKQGGQLAWHGLFWWPLPAAQLSDDVPAAIRECLAEAATAIAAGCPRAAAVMARRALEALCVEKGHEQGVLAKRLEAMVKAGQLMPTMAEWATEVRLIGNRGAHYDPIEPVTREDAETLLAFMRDLVRYVYEMPADLERHRKR